MKISLLLPDNESMVCFQITPPPIPLQYTSGRHAYSLLFTPSPSSSCTTPDWQMATAITNICVDLHMNAMFSFYWVRAFADGLHIPESVGAIQLQWLCCVPCARASMLCCMLKMERVMQIDVPVREEQHWRGVSCWMQPRSANTIE